MRLAALALGLGLAAITTSAQADCKGSLFAIWEGMTNKPYHVSSVSTVNGQQTKMEGTVKLPDQMDITADQARMVMTAEGLWMRQGGQWMQMPDNMKQVVTGLIAQGMDKKNTSNVECLGQKPYEGQAFEAISFTSSGEVMGIKSTAQVVMYVNADQQPAWMVIEGEAMGMKSKTVQSFRFDDSIVIKAPQ